MRAIFRFAAALVAIAALAAPAAAAETGSPAWLLHPTELLEGPGAVYDVVGMADEGGVRIRVERCTELWCRIRTGHQRGWVLLSNVEFGQYPRTSILGLGLGYPSGGGTVCFYTGANYTGTAYCNASGFVAPDLLLHGIDDTLSSVQIEGQASVTACRDADFQSYCERITQSQPHLHGFLDNGLSSYRIY